MNTRNILTILMMLWTVGGLACADQSSIPTTSARSIGENASPADTAISNAEAETEKSPDSPAAFTKLAALYIKKARETGDKSLNKKAQSAIERALEIDSKDATGRKLNAALLASAHKFTEAREAALSLTRDYPADGYAYGILSDSNIELGNYDEAAAAAQMMVDLKPNSTSYARVAQHRSLRGDHTGAVELYTKAAQTADPMDKEAQTWCLVQLANEHFKVGNLDKAARVVDEGLQISPAHPLALTAKARFLAASGDLNGAEEFISRASSAFAQDEALILLGDINLKRGKTDEANRIYAQVETSKRNDGDIHRLALLWADRDIRLGESLSIAESDYATNKDIYASDTYAWSLLKNGRVEEARAMIQNALRLKTNDARILYHAGMIEKAGGNRSAAKRFLRRALKANPSFDLIQSDVLRDVLSKWD